MWFGLWFRSKRCRYIVNRPYFYICINRHINTLSLQIYTLSQSCVTTSRLLLDAYRVPPICAMWFGLWFRSKRCRYIVNRPYFYICINRHINTLSLQIYTLSQSCVTTSRLLLDAYRVPPICAMRFGLWFRSRRCRYIVNRPYFYICTTSTY